MRIKKDIILEIRMFYLYNKDLSQYNDDFWPTVDSYSLAGITVEKSNRADSSGVVVSGLK